MSTSANAAGTGSAGYSIGMIIFYIVLMIALFYFMAIRPQKKEQKKMQAMMSTLETGDVVVTTSGFYGVVIDITEEDVIVEFGSNKNCRIPMRKSAIAQVEKPE
ncbi:MAG: preprotein translocase subunit YajC [Lachnospiraceae bacterium]|nr:preprotein translocase subunit YajC [Lachnospiraceae bacterium]